MSAGLILLAARHRITPPENWTQGALARNAKGKPCPPESPHAVRWCLVGDLQAEGAQAPTVEAQQVRSAVMAALRYLHGEDAQPEALTHEQALAVLVEALLRLG